MLDFDSDVGMGAKADPEVASRCGSNAADRKWGRNGLLGSRGSVFCCANAASLLCSCICAACKYGCAAVRHAGCSRCACGGPPTGSLPECCAAAAAAADSCAAAMSDDAAAACDVTSEGLPSRLSDSSRRSLRFSFGFEVAISAIDQIFGRLTSSLRAVVTSLIDEPPASLLVTSVASLTSVGLLQPAS